MEQQLAYKWLLQNQPLINHSIRFTPGQIDEFFAAYNSITGEKKTKTACGRCIMNMKHRLKTETKKLELMKQYNVYRTAKGNLSLKPNKQGSIFIIHASTDQGAKEALNQLKTFESREDKKIDDNNV